MINDALEEFRKDTLNGIADDQEQSKRQVAMVGPMVRPRHVLNSINSSAEEIGKPSNSSLPHDLKQISFQKL